MKNVDVGMVYMINVSGGQSLSRERIESIMCFIYKLRSYNLIARKVPVVHFIWSIHHFYMRRICVFIVVTIHILGRTTGHVGH